MQTPHSATDKTLKLPPLILHPFSDVQSPQKLVQSSRASLILQGLLPNDHSKIEDLEEILLEGRFCEVRMLYYVGKDLVRWIEQCTGVVEREASLVSANIRWQSFAELVVNDPPSLVTDKLKSWGVADYRTIFSRAIGLNSVFAEVPERLTLTPDFIRNYHQYADQMFAVRQGGTQFATLRSADFEFELYASGEYSRMLEKQWQET